MKIETKIVDSGIVLFLLVLAACGAFSWLRPSAVHAQNNLQTGPYACARDVIVSATASGNTTVIAPTNATIRVCQVIFNVAQTASPASFSLVTGTGTACASGQSQMTPVYTGVASTTQTYAEGVHDSVWWGRPSGNGLCLDLSAAVTSATVHVFYDLY